MHDGYLHPVREAYEKASKKEQQTEISQACFTSMNDGMNEACCVASIDGELNNAEIKTAAKRSPVPPNEKSK